jgi:lipopolysaccharide biosynthesis protein
MTHSVDGEGGRPADAPATAAFYLPQFHAIPENDEWWGEGFTEWTNVGRAEAMFPGHRQPVRPAGPHGHYNLIDPAVVAWQTDLAARHDVDAFVYYHYWFDGHRLLERPLDNYLHSEHSHPFAICWANENWTRRWDGKEREVLMAQNYGPNTPADVFQSFLPYLSDPRYLQVGGKALLLVHRADHLPEPRRFADEWRALADAHGIGELWIVASETWAGVDPHLLGFDAVAEFPPVGDSTLGVAVRRLPRGLRRGYRGRINSYTALAERYCSRPPVDFPRHPAVVPGWDNTARRGAKATLFVGSHPAIYSAWLADARARERAARGSSGVVFVNAWNEWAEGAYLEPDTAHGYAYLEATRWSSGSSHNGASPATPLSGRPNLRGLATAAASSTKSLVQSRSGLGR